MTRRDYIIIADVLRRLGEDAACCFDSATDREYIACAFAEALAKENPNFDGDRFIKAATPLGNEAEALEEKDNA